MSKLEPEEAFLLGMVNFAPSGSLSLEEAFYFFEPGKGEVAACVLHELGLIKWTAEDRLEPGD